MATFAGSHPPLFRPSQLLKLPPPLQREPAALLEFHALRRDPVWRHEGVPDAPPQPVALVPGFLAGDASLAALTDWLRRGGHRTARVGIRMNVGCSTALLDRLEERVERLADRHDGPITVVGQSRGGLLARGLAMRRPDLVARLVTLGSPLVEPLAVHPVLLAQVAALSTLGSLGVPGLFTQGCFRGECCEEFRRQAFSPLPDGVRHVSVFSRSDGVVDWRSCLVRGAEHVEIRGTHFGMADNRHVYRLLAGELARRDPPVATLAAAA